MSLPPDRVGSGDQAFALLRAVEPVAQRIETAEAESRKLADVLSAAAAAARSGTALGPHPPRGLGAVRAPGLPAPVVEEIAPTDGDLLTVAERAGETLLSWAAVGLGDCAVEAAGTVLAAVDGG